jgi:hypothetical protein
LDAEIQLINDGNGVAVIGEPAAVERFLAAEGLVSRDLGLERLKPALRGGANAVQVVAETAGVVGSLAENSGRWVKLTSESAHAMEKWGLMTSTKTGLAMGVVKPADGAIKKIVQFEPGSALPSAQNLASLAGPAALMAQIAMQQQMDRIEDYLAAIDEKVDDILRAQKDAVLADMVGVDLVIQEAMAVREAVGLVSDVTWSKVQATAHTIASTQSYALRQLDAIAEKLESKAKLGDVAKAAKDAEPKVQEWLAVLAQSFRLQDALSVLELDRVLGASPEGLDAHRRGLAVARQERLELIGRSTEHLLARINDVAGMANAKVLLHPATARAVVHASNHVASGIVGFHEVLGLERDGGSVEARRWLDAATEVKDKVLETGEAGVGAARGLGNETLDRARLATGRLASGIADRALRPRGEDADGEPGLQTDETD